MRVIKPKLCQTCGKSYQPTGTMAKFCLPCRPSKASYKDKRVKHPGVGSGHSQGCGPTHHSFKPDAPHRFRDYLKTSCERCGSTRFLCCHHKDRDRTNNEKQNIETLCKSCHQIEHDCASNFNSQNMAEALRSKLSANMINLNKHLPRLDGKNASPTKKGVVL